MSVGLVEFVYTAMASGVVGNATYDGVKALLNVCFGEFSGYVKNNDRDEFRKRLLKLLESNEELKKELMTLKNGGNINKVSKNKKTEVDIENRTPENENIVDENEDSKVTIKNL